MALIKCPECGRERVSDSALACPECGFEIRSYFEAEKKRAEEDSKVKEKAEKELADKKEKISKLGKELSIKLNKLENSKSPKKKWESISFVCKMLIGGMLFTFILFFLAIALLNLNGEFSDIVITIFFAVLLLMLPILITHIIAKTKIKNLTNWEDDVNRQKEELKKDYEKRVENIMKYGNSLGVDLKTVENNKTNKHIHKCPICGSTDIKRLTVVNRFMSIFMFGFASAKVGKQFECGNCEYRW